MRVHAPLAEAAPPSASGTASRPRVGRGRGPSAGGRAGWGAQYTGILDAPRVRRHHPGLVPLDDAELAEDELEDEEVADARVLAVRIGPALPRVSRLFGGYIKTVEAQTLAVALNVDPTWLATGLAKAPTPTGPMVPMPGGYDPTAFVAERTLELEDRYPNRAIAAGIARRGGVAKEAIASVLEDQLQADVDPPELWWLDRMRLRENMLRSKELPGRPASRDKIRRPRGARPRQP
jgi:hypothetical protein